MPAFFVSSLDIRETQITLTGDLCHHVRASLRVKPGEDLWLTDEQRRRYRVRVTYVSQQAVMTEILEQRLGPVETGPPCCSHKPCSKATIWIGWCKRRASWACGRSFPSSHGMGSYDRSRTGSPPKWPAGSASPPKRRNNRSSGSPRKCWNRWSHAASSPLTKRPARFSWQNAMRLPHWPGYPCRVSPRNSSP